jgi:hypothetical protein
MYGAVRHRASQHPGGQRPLIADPTLVESTLQSFLGVRLRQTEAEISEYDRGPETGLARQPVTSALDGPITSLHKLLTADLDGSGCGQAGAWANTSYPITSSTVIVTIKRRRHKTRVSVQAVTPHSRRRGNARLK